MNDQGQDQFKRHEDDAAFLTDGIRLHITTNLRRRTRVAGGERLRPEDLVLFKGDAYSQHRADLGKLDIVVKRKRPCRTASGRVACSAYGTVLASRRLHAYLPTNGSVSILTKYDVTQVKK
jgi:hypothetical protein